VNIEISDRPEFNPARTGHLLIACDSVEVRFSVDENYTTLKDK